MGDLRIALASVATGFEVMAFVDILKQVYYVTFWPGSTQPIRDSLAGMPRKHTPLTLWIQSAVFRVDALETILHKKKAATKSEIRQEMAAALLRHPLSENPDNSKVVQDLLKDAPATLSDQGSSV